MTVQLHSLTLSPNCARDTRVRPLSAVNDKCVISSFPTLSTEETSLELSWCCHNFALSQKLSRSIFLSWQHAVTHSVLTGEAKVLPRSPKGDIPLAASDVRIKRVRIRESRSFSSCGGSQRKKETFMHGCGEGLSALTRLSDEEGASEEPLFRLFDVDPYRVSPKSGPGSL